MLHVFSLLCALSVVYIIYAGLDYSPMGPSGKPIQTLIFVCMKTMGPSTSDDRGISISISAGRLLLCRSPRLKLYLLVYIEINSLKVFYFKTKA